MGDGSGRNHDLIGDERTGDFRSSTLAAEFVSLADPVVESAWSRLQREGHVDSPFLSWQWYSAMRDCPELCAAVTVLACWSDREIVGLLPLERVTRDGLRVVGIAGWQWAGPDHAEVIGPAAKRVAIARAILHALHRDRSWDVLDFDGIHPDGALATALPTVLHAPHFVHRSAEPLPITYVPLDGRILSPRARKRLGKDLAQVEATGGRFEKVTSPDRFPALLENLMDMHVARFGSRSQVFTTPARRRFHHLAAQRLGSAGMARMHVLQVGETVAAVNYTLAWQGTILYYSSGMRPDIAANPGSTVRALSMIAAADDGFTQADLLRGEHSYKGHFEAVVRNDVRMRVIRVGPRVVATAAVRTARGAVHRIRGMKGAPSVTEQPTRTPARFVRNSRPAAIRPASASLRPIHTAQRGPRATAPDSPGGSVMSSFPALAHVAVTVTDLERSNRWYTTLFGSEAVLDEDEAVGGFHHTVYLLSAGQLFGLHSHPRSDAGGPFDERRTGLDHVSFACTDRVELEQWAARLEELGIAHGGIVDAHYGSGVSFRDPDGIALEFFAPPSGT